MNRLLLLLVFIAVTGCAHLFGRQERAVGESRARLWDEAHVALYQEAFARADSLFAVLTAEHPHTDEGREAIFYVGALHLDPRNELLNPERAETALQRYLQQDTVGGVIHRRPEALTLLAIARQQNRLSGEPVASAPDAEPLPAAATVDELQESIRELRRQLRQRDEQIQRQSAELDRIRRALAPRNP